MPHNPLQRWSEPAQSTASRRPGSSSRYNFRGEVVCPRRNQRYVFESFLELKMLQTLLADRRVRNVEEQPPAVLYRADDGAIHRHWFDMRATRHDDVRIAFAIRPEAKADSLRKLLKQMRPQIPQSFADYALLRTDRDLPPSRTDDAVTILRYRETKCDVAINAVEIGRLVATTGLKDAAFGAIVNLIDDTALALCGRSITYHALVQRNPQVNIWY